MKNDIGQKFGKLTPVELEKDKNGYYSRYTCRCDCGNIHSVSKSHIRRGLITHCGCVRRIGAKHSQWKGVGEISGDFWYGHVVRSANGSKGNRRKKELTLTIQQAWDLFLKQERKCALSGIKLTFPKVSKDKAWTASLDRIDSSIGYTIDNVQWVHKDVNIMKNEYDNQYFIEMCKLIAKRVKLAEEVVKEMSQMKPITDTAKDLSDHVDKIVLVTMIEIAKSAGGACEIA